MHSNRHFDQKARDWDVDPRKTALATAVADAIREKLPLSLRMRALEYGCGTGLLSFGLQPYLGQITLADSSLGMLEVLSEKLAASPMDNMRPVRLDLTIDPIPQERFDLIYTSMTFHHIEDTDAMLGKLHSLLSPGGHLCIADLDAEDGSFHGPEFTGHRGFHWADIARQTRNAGFRNVDFRTVFHLHRNDSAGQTEFPVFLMVAEK